MAFISPTSESVSHRHIEDFLIIWLDKHIEDDDTTEQSIGKLREVVHNVDRFESPDECMNYLLDVVDARILFIFSNTFDDETLVCFHELSQIHSIYVLNQRGENPKQVLKLTRKIPKMMLCIDDLCEQIHRDIRRSNYDLIHFNVVGKTIQGHNNKQEASFMYAQLFKETLLKTTDGDEHEIAQFSRIQYVGNPKELCFIDEFEQTYNEHSPVWWYTRQSFLYKTLNKALRDRHVETLYAFRYFTRQLNEQLRTLRMTCVEKNMMTLYRGQSLPKAQFHMLKKNVGGLLSFSNFLSTTSDVNVALMFTGGDEERMPVLMIINIDLSIEGDAFYADIDSISYFAEHEKEWLFSMGSVFRIGSVKKNKENIWMVDLTLTSDHDRQLMELTQHLRKTIEDVNPIYQFGRLMLEMDELKTAEKFYQSALEKMTEWRQHATILHQLGTLCDAQKELDRALEYFQSSLRIYRDHVSDDDPLLSCTYNNIGLTYAKQKKHDLSLEYLHRALNIELAASQPKQENISRNYNNIAAVLSDQDKDAEALIYYQRAFDIKLETFPCIHPTIALSYSNIAASLHSLKRLNEALEYQQKAVDIDLQSLPPGHTQTLQHQQLLAGYQLLKEIRNQHNE